MNRDADQSPKNVGVDQETNPALEQAWLDEIRRRVAELDSGAVRAVPWSEARARLLAKLPK